MTCIPDKYKYGASRGLYKTTRFFPVTWIKKLSITWDECNNKRCQAKVEWINIETSTDLIISLKKKINKTLTLRIIL